MGVILLFDEYLLVKQQNETHIIKFLYPVLPVSAFYNNILQQLVMPSVSPVLWTENFNSLLRCWFNLHVFLNDIVLLLPYLQRILQ